MISGIDEGFIRRVYITSSYVFAFGLLASWSIAGMYAAAGWVVGSVISVGLLRAIEWFIRGTVRPDNTRAGASITVAALVHWPVLIGVLGAGIWLGRDNFPYIIAFCTGLVLTQAVIVLKVVGMLVNGHLNK